MEVNRMKKSSGIKAKDLITTGIFTAIMFALCMAVAMLGYIPIFIPLLGIIVPLIDGIPYVLFVSKTKGINITSCRCQRILAISLNLSRLMDTCL